MPRAPHQLLPSREALLAAMIAESASFGFRETTVARIVIRADVSRSEFYRHFPSKEECFLASFDELTQRAWSRVAFASEMLTPTLTDPPAGLRAGIGMLLDVAHLQPESALCVAQARCAGTQAGERLDGTLELFEQALLYPGARKLKAPGRSATVVTGIVGGIYRVIYERLSSGRERELPGLLDEIVEWMLLYDNPDRARTPRRRKKLAPGEREADSAQAASPGAQSMRRAQLAAYERGVERLMLTAEERLRGAPDWPAGVRAALGAVAELLAGEPALLELLTVRIFTLGEAGRERDGQSLAAFARLLAPRAEGGKEPSPLVSELIAGGIWEILYRHAIQGQARELPTRVGALSYLALTPFIGREAAARAR
jgi:AcrR family transcriptional regulator